MSGGGGLQPRLSALLLLLLHLLFAVWEAVTSALRRYAAQTHANLSRSLQLPPAVRRAPPPLRLTPCSRLALTGARTESRSRPQTSRWAPCWASPLRTRASCEPPPPPLPASASGWQPRPQPCRQRQAQQRRSATSCSSRRATRCESWHPRSRRSSQPPRCAAPPRLSVRDGAEGGAQQELRRPARRSCWAGGRPAERQGAVAWCLARREGGRSRLWRSGCLAPLMRSLRPCTSLSRTATQSFLARARTPPLHPATRTSAAPANACDSQRRGSQRLACSPPPRTVSSWSAPRQPRGASSWDAPHSRISRPGSRTRRSCTRCPGWPD
jgi:hypothetical protein